MLASAPRYAGFSPALTLLRHVLQYDVIRWRLHKGKNGKCTAQAWGTLGGPFVACLLFLGYLLPASLSTGRLVYDAAFLFVLLAGKNVFQFQLRRRPGQGELVSQVGTPGWWAAVLAGPTCCWSCGAGASGWEEHANIRPTCFQWGRALFFLQSVEWGAISVPRKLVPNNRQGVVTLDISGEGFVRLNTCRREGVKILRWVGRCAMPVCNGD